MLIIIQVQTTMSASREIIAIPLRLDALNVLMDIFPTIQSVSFFLSFEKKTRGKNISHKFQAWEIVFFLKCLEKFQKIFKNIFLSRTPAGFFFKKKGGFGQSGKKTGFFFERLIFIRKLGVLFLTSFRSKKNTILKTGSQTRFYAPKYSRRRV